jgi:DNA-binding LytR/AlgR family response regulator
MEQDNDLLGMFLQSANQPQAAPKQHTDFFFIRTSKTKVSSFKNDALIAAFASDKSILLYVRIDCQNPHYCKHQLKNITMEDLVNCLQNYPYVQCHKQCLFNLNYFAGIDGDEILLTCKIDKHVYIGRTFKEQVREALKIYFFQKNCFWLFGKF